MNINFESFENATGFPETDHAEDEIARIKDRTSQSDFMEFIVVTAGKRPGFVVQVMHGGMLLGYL